MVNSVAPGQIRVRLLGPVAVATNDRWQPISGRRRSAVLAAMALQPRETISADRLVDIVWGARAPRTAGDTLRNHVSYLRGILPADAVIVARSAGYVMEIGPDGTDVEAAEHLIAQATRATDAGQRKSKLQAAVGLWRGSALADLADLSWFDEQALRLQRLLLDARRLLIDTRLEVGEYQQVVAELEDICREHPLDEPLHAQLMIALSRAGRQAEALAAYQRIRRALDEELGVLPAAALRDLNTAILRQDTVVAAFGPAVGAAATRPTSPPVPAQLPPAIVTFAGRDQQAAALDVILTHSREGAGPVVVSICGTAGVGKTALAVYWAHQVKHQFPDGQLYVDLRGFDPGGAPMDPAEAVRGFLDSLGVPHDRIPMSPQAQFSLFRSELTGKRMLIVADNAREENQVRPLLPGAPGCLVVVTSRSQLLGLVAADGAQPLFLDRPTVAEARQMLAQRLGTLRVDSEPGAVEEIIARCARLPLALAVAAAPAALSPDLPLAQLAAQLRDAAITLDPFDNPDPPTNVRAVFSWSYQVLSEPAAQLFRLLAQCPGRDVTTAAAASLAAQPISRAQLLLNELANAHLINQHAPGRYSQHDLLRAFATELAHTTDTEQQRHAATHRILDHYLHTAHAATLLIRPTRDQITLSAPAPGVTPQPLADRDAALAWFQAEHSVLLATMFRPPDSFDHHTWQLAWTLLSYLAMHGHWRDNRLVQQAGLRAADRLGDPTAQAYAHRCLARVYGQLGRPADAHPHIELALHLFEQAGDVAETATTLFNLSQIAERQKDIQGALTHAEAAHRAYQSVGSASGQAYTANAIGWCQAQLGEHRSGLPYCQEALDIFLDIGDLVGAASTWDSLGALHFGIGDAEQGDHCYRQAITLFRELGDRFIEAEAYANLFHGHTQMGNHDAAHQARQEAIAILNELEPDAAAQIRAQLEPTPLVL